MSLFGVQITAQINRLMMQIRLQLSKSKYCPNFRTIYASLVSYDKEVSGFIQSSDFQKCLNNNGIFLKKYDIQVFEKAYNNENNLLNWFAFMSYLREPMGPNRRQFVEQIFDFMDDQKKQQITPQNLMQFFNPKEIQFYKMGLKSKQTVKQQFLSMISIPQKVIKKQEFVAFYDDLNINFIRNQIFFRFVGSQWNYSFQKQTEVKEEDIKAVLKELRTKLIQSTQCTKDEYLMKKQYDSFDINHNGCISTYQFDLILKQMNIEAQPKMIQPILQRIDYNGTGFLEYIDFKKFLLKDPYPV